MTRATAPAPGRRTARPDAEPFTRGNADAAPADPVQALRAFNRFYTRRIGVLGAHLPGGRFSLAESRVLWELAQRDGLTAASLARELDLDRGYLSRLLARLRTQRLVRAGRAPHDARQQPLSLTAAGRRAFAPLDAGAQRAMAELLAPLPPARRQALVRATQRVEALLGTASNPEVTLRPHRAGDIGWVVSRHGALYAAEYGWDLRFEALVARIAADFVDRFEPRREACWIAVRGEGVAEERLGCVFLVQARHDDGRPDEGVAQLRMLLVEPSARGLGLGKRLTQACEDFARGAGYGRIRLWTNSVLLAARGIYRAAGYRKVASERHASFGAKLVGETWEKDLEKDLESDLRRIPAARAASPDPAPARPGARRRRA